MLACLVGKDFSITCKQMLGRAGASGGLSPAADGLPAGPRLGVPQGQEASPGIAEERHGCAEGEHAPSQSGTGLLHLKAAPCRFTGRWGCRAALVWLTRALLRLLCLLSWCSLVERRDGFWLRTLRPAPVRTKTSVQIKKNPNLSAFKSA